MAAVITEPLEAKKDAGWLAPEKPGDGVFNWWMNLVYAWLDYTNNSITYLDGAKLDKAGGTITGDLTIGDDLIVTDDASVGGDLTVTGDATVSTDLHVTGDLDVAGNASISGSLSVTGGISAENMAKCIYFLHINAGVVTVLWSVENGQSATFSFGTGAGTNLGLKIDWGAPFDDENSYAALSRFDYSVNASTIMRHGVPGTLSRDANQMHIHAFSSGNVTLDFSSLANVYLVLEVFGTLA